MDSLDTFTLAPMSAGDIIDRAVRIYRRNFLALLRIVLLPSMVAYAGGILYSIGIRNFSVDRGDARVFSTVSMILLGGLLWLIGKAAFYAVLGGASRAIVYHFFDGTPLRARDVYKTVREKFWSIIGAMFMVWLLALGLAFVIYFIMAFLILVYAAVAGLVGSGLPLWFTIIANVVFGILLVVTVIVGLLMVYSRVVYVPQVLLVEGKGVYSSISRSFSLAHGEVMRIGALILFWFYIAWSIWILLMVPLGWYGYWAGIDINPFGGEEPLWYSISRQTLTQMSEILIAPIAMLGFTLLYIDSRVRKEGFDVEMLANRLMEAPPYAPPPQEIFGQEVVTQPATGFYSNVPSILGLNDYRPIVTAPAVPDPVIHSPEPAARVDHTVFSANIESEAQQGDGEFLPSDSFFDSSYLDPVSIQSEPQSTVSSGPDETIPENAPVEPAISPVDGPPKVAAPIENVQRRCQWCSTPAGMEDRFCRVCGSVF